MRYEFFEKVPVIEKEMYKDGNTLISHRFWERIMEHVANGNGFILELSKNGNLPPVWFCWTSFEKNEPSMDTIKWIHFEASMRRNHSVKL